MFPNWYITWLLTVHPNYMIFYYCMGFSGGKSTMKYTLEGTMEWRINLRKLPPQEVRQEEKKLTTIINIAKPLSTYSIWFTEPEKDGCVLCVFLFFWRGSSGGQTRIYIYTHHASIETLCEIDGVVQFLHGTLMIYVYGKKWWELCIACVCVFLLLLRFN